MAVDPERVGVARAAVSRRGLLRVGVLDLDLAQQRLVRLEVLRERLEEALVR